MNIHRINMLYIIIGIYNWSGCSHNLQLFSTIIVTFRTIDYRSNLTKYIILLVILDCLFKFCARKKRGCFKGSSISVSKMESSFIRACRAKRLIVGPRRVVEEACMGEERGWRVRLSQMESLAFICAWAKELIVG